MNLRTFFAPIAVGLLGVACTRNAVDVPAAAPQTAVVEKKIKVPERDPHLQQIVKLSAQADQVLREAWWVVANERRGVSRSAFGKLERAAQQAMDGKLATKVNFLCDRYEWKKEGQGAQWRAVFFESCRKNSTREIASWTFLKGGPGLAGQARVEFQSPHLEEVLGLGASIFGRVLKCEIFWSERGILERLQCPRWEQDREKQLVRLETFDFRREGGSLLTLKGNILENLLPVRKIEAVVPLEGKIIVTETELNPPTLEGEVGRPAAAPLPQAKVLSEQEKSALENADPTTFSRMRRGSQDGKTPLATNPDLLQMQKRKGGVVPPKDTARKTPEPPPGAPEVGEGPQMIPGAENLGPGLMLPDGVVPSPGMVPEGYEVIRIPAQPPQESLPQEEEPPTPSPVPAANQGVPHEQNQNPQGR